VTGIDADLIRKSVANNPDIPECQVLAVVESDGVALDRPQGQILERGFERVDIVPIDSSVGVAQERGMHVIDLKAFDR